MDRMSVKLVILIVLQVPHRLQIAKRVKLGITYKEIIVIHVVASVRHVKTNKVNIGMAACVNPAHRHAFYVHQFYIVSIV